jgi:anaerobic magnesium-protoporphyrin IX monomethyl ester cyclase
MKIAFVHTPMAVFPLPERALFWRNFDRQYHGAHPGLRPMRRPMWELPHWMPWLAGVLEAHGFTDMHAMDFYTSETTVKGICVDKVLPTIRATPSDVYLFSPMTPNLAYAFEIAELIKAEYPEATIVFGGVVATPLRLEVAAHPAVDYVVHDRGEYALVALLKALEAGKSPLTVGNLCFKRSKKVVTTPLVYPFPPVAEIPFPKVDLFEPDIGHDLRYLRIVYGLGCPYECDFCTIQTIGRKASYFAIDRVLAEIRAYRSHYGNHHNIYFGDETFTASKRRTLDICSALEDEGNVFFDCQTRPNCLGDTKVLAALRDAGCRWVEIGLESINQETQNIFKQRAKLGGLEDTLKRLRDCGLPACSFLVNGFPNQTVDDMRRSVELACELIAKDLLQASYFFGLVPYPGSAIFDRPDKYGMTLKHRDFKLYHEELEPVYSTHLATSDQIYSAFLEGVGLLASAMDKTPALGSLDPSIRMEDLGNFWATAHV